MYLPILPVIGVLYALYAEIKTFGNLHQHTKANYDNNNQS